VRPESARLPLFELARFPNLYLKFSSETIYAAQAGTKHPARVLQQVDRVLRPQRIMWGSNYPATYDRSLKEQFAMAREELAFLPDRDQRWCFGGTALALWPMSRERRNFGLIPVVTAPEPSRNGSN
jgi:predicted TIM-barrel fold metal-dependent hydrolase